MCEESSCPFVPVQMGILRVAWLVQDLDLEATHPTGQSYPLKMGFCEVAQSCPTLSDRIDYSPPGSSVHGIFQARVLEWGAIAFSFLVPFSSLESE